jgi:hypothetical protein
MNVLGIALILGSVILLNLRPNIHRSE